MTPVKTTTEKFVGVLVVGLLIKRTVDHARDVRAYRRRSRERARSVGSRAGFDRPVPGQWEWPVKPAALTGACAERWIARRV
jgi:hypothetical protein